MSRSKLGFQNKSTRYSLRISVQADLDPNISEMLDR